MLNVVKTRLASLETWRTKSTNRRIFVAAVTVGGVTVLVKLVAMLKELLVANWFGTSDEIDAYLVAYLLAFFSVSVIAESFSVALLPIYIQMREKDGLANAQRFFSHAMFGVIGVLLCVTLLLCLTSPLTLQLLGSNFNSGKLALTQTLFFIMIPILMIRGISTVWSVILNSDEQFALASVTPLLVPLTTLGFLLVEKSVYGMAVGTVFGFLIEFILLATRVHQQGFSLVPVWGGITPEIKQLAEQYSPMVAGVLLMTTTILVDQAMAASLGSGSVASLTYANRIVAVILTVGSLAIGTAVLPHFSKMIALNDWQGLRRTFLFYVGLIFAITTPFVMVMILFSEPLARLLYQRGEFTTQDTHLVSRVQIFYLLQTPFYIMTILEVRLISALKANQVILRATILNVIINFSLNVVLMRSLGLAGIALSTSGVYFFSFVYLSVFLWRNYGVSNGK